MGRRLTTAPLLDSTDRGPQAPHSRRHARPPVERLRRCRRCPRSRRCHSTAVPDATPVPVHRAHLRRWRLSGREDGQCRHQDRRLETRDRQALRSSSFRRLAQALDRRAHLCMDQPQPPTCPRLRTSRPQSRCLRSTGHDPSHPQAAGGKPIIMNPNFPDGLLDLSTLPGPA